jgi:predicted enzyme related to lactoylglutathione lyase
MLMTNQPVMYIQVNTSDRQSTARFYADVFHWEIHHEPTYTWFEADPTTATDDEGKAELAPFIVLIEPETTNIVYPRSA